MRAPITVVIVDDDLLVRTLIRDVLSQHRDLRVTGTFGSGPEALEAVAANPPDVMVVDILMPGMDGAELTRRVRSKHSEVQILAYTSLADEKSLSRILNSGAAGVVYKESTPSVLADAIRATCAGLSVLSRKFTARLARPELADSLTQTESGILRLLSCGLTNEQIGAAVHLSPSTVKYHIAKLTERLEVSNRVALAVLAVHLGFDDPAS